MGCLTFNPTKVMPFVLYFYSGDVYTVCYGSGAHSLTLSLFIISSRSSLRLYSPDVSSVCYRSDTHSHQCLSLSLQNRLIQVQHQGYVVLVLVWWFGV